MSPHQSIGRQAVTAALLAALVLAGCASADDPGDEAAPVVVTTTETPDDAGLEVQTAPANDSGDSTFTADTDGDEATGRWPVPLSSISPSTPERWAVEVLATAPHDPEAFTQGLEELGDGRLLESTGRRGLSEVRIVDPASGEVERRADLEPQEFGEGLTIVDNTVIQLTWQEQVARRWTLPNLDPLPSFSYDGEGWGLCESDGRLAMSDGSATITWRDAETFAVIEVVTVTRSGEPIDRLNELECIDGHVVANIWQSPEIVVIRPTGDVIATIDGSALVETIDTDDSNAVLNGIAAHDDGTFSLTGKLWPTRFVVRLVAS